MKDRGLPFGFSEAAESILGSDGWTENADVLRGVETPWRGTARGYALGLASPRNTEQVADFIRLCNQYSVPVTPRGGNTGLVEGGVPDHEVVISLKRMSAVRNADKFNNTLTIDAGATLVQAQQAAAEAGRLFPLSLGSEGDATIGGLVSTNAGGVAVLKYGMMRDLVLGLEVVLPTGDVWRNLSGLRKDNTGYDLKHLFAGAEGTLGIITGATLKLFPTTHKATAWISCKSEEQVIKLLAVIQDHAGDTVTGFEMIPEMALRLVLKDFPNLRDPDPSALPWRVLCEISMAREEFASTLLFDALEAALENGCAENAVLASSVDQARSFWSIREVISLSKRKLGVVLDHDVSVPVSQIPGFMSEAGSFLAAEIPSAFMLAFGHVGDGNIHFAVCDHADSHSSELADKAEKVTRAVHDLVAMKGGSISAEHGVGRMKRDELYGVRPKTGTSIMESIKKCVDPLNIINSDRVVRSFRNEG